MMAIVIGRQFGSGGRRIGKAVAAKLGIPYYDREILEEASRSLGMSAELFAQADEKRPSMLQNILQGLYGIADGFQSTGMNAEKLYQMQSKAIREICSSGDCVVVGRTADYVMRDDPSTVSVFLHAPIQWRAEKIVRRGDCNCCEEAVTFAQRKDREREGYYNYFTGRQWGAADNYHLTADASQLTEDALSDLIISFAANKRNRGDA